MKICAFSDLHGNLDGLDPQDADIVVIAGDVAPMKGWGVWHVNDQVKWINKRFAAWCDKCPDAEIVLIPAITTCSHSGTTCRPPRSSARG